MLDVEVTVVGNPGATDGAPVEVHVVQTAVENALAVPVHALLALAGGGYGVELADTQQDRSGRARRGRRRVRPGEGQGRRRGRVLVVVAQ